MFIRMLVLMLALTGFAMPAAAAFQLDGEPKIAFILHFSIGSDGWTEAHNNARLKVEEALGVKTTYTENIPEETTKVRQTIDLLVSRGHNIIVGTSYGYGDAFLEAAKQYPNVAFVNSSGDTTYDNLESFYARTYQGYYLAGIVAGSMSDSGRIGMLSPFPLSLVNWDINGFTQGVRSVNPDASVTAVFASVWLDPVKETQLAQALLEQDLDVIASGMSAAALIVAERAGVDSVGYQVDMSSNAPNGHLTSVVFHWENYLIPTIKAIIAGTWEPNPHGAFLGLKEGVVGLSPLNSKVPEDVIEKVRVAKEAIIAGELDPFAGPLAKQDGALAVKAGENLNDGQIWSMDYFVEGVNGVMPN